MEEKMVNENNTMDNVNFVEENNLADVAGGKGAELVRCTENPDSPFKVHRCVLAKKDMPMAENIAENRKFCGFHCLDCGQGMTLMFDIESNDYHRAWILEAGKGVYYYRGEWK